MVSYDLIQIQKTWLDSTIFDFNTAKHKEIAKVDELELIYYDAWIRSCKGVISQTQKARQKIKSNNDSEIAKELVKINREQVGDPRFLAGVQWCIERRCKIIGIDAPTKIDVNWQEEARRDGVDPVSIFEKMVAEAAARMEAEDSIDTDADTN